MLYVIIALIVVLSYMTVKLYSRDLKEEFADFGTFVKDWVGCFSKDELGQEIKLLGYELVEVFKSFLVPVKTLGCILLVTVAPIALVLLNIVTAVIKVHRRK